MPDQPEERMVIYTFNSRQMVIIMDGIRELCDKHAVSHLLRERLGDKNWDETNEECKVNKERAELGKALLQAAEETFTKEEFVQAIEAVAMRN